MTAPQYVFRDDLQADKDRKQELATQGLGMPPAPSLQPVTTPTEPKPAATGGDAFAAFGKQAATQAQATTAPKADQNPFEAFSAALEAQNPFKQKVQQGITQTLDNPYAAPDAAAKAARDRLARETNAAAEERRSQAVTAYGGYGTGQATRDLNKFQDQRLLNEQDFELQNLATREAAGQSARQGAISQGLGLLGQETQGAQTLAGLADAAAGRASGERIALAQLSVQEKQLAQAALQAKDEMAFKREALASGNSQAAIDRAWQAAQQEKQLASQEKLGFANLSVREKEIAQAGAQFDKELDFKRYATDAGLTDAQAQRAWQAVQNEKEIASREKISFAQLSFQEKQLVQEADQFDNELDFKKAALANGNDQAAIDRAWNASQNAEERAAREKLANAQIGSTERLQASAQTFQASETEKQRILDTMLSNDRIQAQYVLANMDQTFQEKMQQTGYLQTKDLQTMKQDFEKELTNIGIKADVAKQLSDQQFQGMMAKNEQVFDATQAELNRTWETGERIGAQDWQTSLKQLEFKQEQLIQARDAANQRGMQTKQIEAEIQKVGMQIASQELMSAAELAQNNAQFQKEWMLKNQVTREELFQSRARLQDDLATSVLQRSGLNIQNQQMAAALKNDKVNAALELANIGMTMGNGSPEAMAPFVAQMGAALEAAFKEQGIDVSAEAMAKAFGPLATSPTGAGYQASGTKGDVANAQATLNDVLEGLKNKVDVNKVSDLIDAIGSEDASRLAPGGTFASKDLPPAIRKTFATNGTFYSLGNGAYVIDGKSPNKQLATDTIGLYQIINSGVPKETAKQILLQAIGQSRYDAAAKVMGA